jgi:tetratricopeptide (TPR) repeat protein
MQAWIRSVPSSDSRLRLAVLALCCAALVAGATWIVRGGASSAPAVPAAIRGGDAAAPAADVGSSDGLLPPDARVAFWERRVAAGGGYLDLIHLADAYVDRTRASGDIADLRRAQLALAQALETTPNPSLVRVREAQVAFSLHEFSRALEIGDEVLASAPDDLTALTVTGDSLLELGQLDAASERYDRLAELAPSSASWSRLGRLAFLRGDADAALGLVTRAADEADAGFPDEIAFYHVQLGDLERATGRLTDAAAAYGAALAALPGHPAASVGMAHVREAEGRRSDAIALMEAAVRRLPQPEWVATLGDLYALDGQSARADEQYALVDAIAGLGDGAAVYDRVYIGFLADHGRQPGEAVRRAQVALESRADVFGYDALAWALFANRDITAAADAARQAMALGTPDPRMRYHAGLIAMAQGRDAEALEFLLQARDGSAMLPPLQVARLDEVIAELGESQP